MGKIEVKRRAPAVFMRERDIKSSEVSEALIVKNSLNRLADYPDFGVCLQEGGKPWYDQPDGPFNPYSDECGDYDFNEAHNESFLICGMEGDEDVTIRFCDFSNAFNESFSICDRGEGCKPIKRDIKE